jgi:hypothetical protein
VDVDVDVAETAAVVGSGEYNQHQNDDNEHNDSHENDSISVLTDNLLLSTPPERVPEKAKRDLSYNYLESTAAVEEARKKQRLSDDEEKDDEVEEERETFNKKQKAEEAQSALRYRDIIEDYLVYFSEKILLMIAFFHPKQRYDNYSEYLNAKLNYFLWPITLVFPSVLVEMIKFAIVSYLLFLGSCFLVVWYWTRVLLWFIVLPWTLTQRSFNYLLGWFVALSVTFVNNSRGGNKIPKALNGHVMKHET